MRNDEFEEKVYNLLFRMNVRAAFMFSLFMIVFLVVYILFLK